MTDVRRDVVLVANNLDEIGGVQRVTHNLATMLQEAGHRVTAVGIQHAAAPHDYGIRSYPTVVVNEEPVGPPLPRERWHERLRPAARARRRASELARRRTVRTLGEVIGRADDCIVVVMQVWAMEWVAAADTARARVIGMSHESFDATLASTRWERVNRFYRDVDLLLLLTERDAEQFELEGFNNVAVMHNALPFYPDEVSPLSEPTVIAVGRLAREKGYDRLIDAFAAVADHYPDWSLRLVGHGPQREALLRRAADLGLGERVQLPGLTDDVEAELRKASVFALSSVHEGLPMALAEAMACGVPAVAFDCAPGVREIVTDGVDGIVVPPRNVPALSAGLATLMGDENLRRLYGAAAHRNVAKFAPEVVLAQWESVFDLVNR